MLALIIYRIYNCNQKRMKTNKKFREASEMKPTPAGSLTFFRIRLQTNPLTAGPSLTSPLPDADGREASGVVTFDTMPHERIQAAVVSCGRHGLLLNLMALGRSRTWLYAELLVGRQGGGVSLSVTG